MCAASRQPGQERPDPAGGSGLGIGLLATLDDAVYARVPAMTGFIQNDPVEGAPASERTEVWILFDDEQLYLSARCWESRPDRLRATEMRRDNSNIAQDDNLAWAFDTFYDRRNGMLFEVNAAGGRMDGQTSNEGRSNFD